MSSEKSEILNWELYRNQIILALSYYMKFPFVEAHLNEEGKTNGKTGQIDHAKILAKELLRIDGLPSAHREKKYGEKPFGRFSQLLNACRRGKTNIANPNSRLYQFLNVMIGYQYQQTVDFTQLTTSIGPDYRFPVKWFSAKSDVPGNFTNLFTLYVLKKALFDQALNDSEFDNDKLLDSLTVAIERFEKRTGDTFSYVRQTIYRFIDDDTHTKAAKLIEDYLNPDKIPDLTFAAFQANTQNPIQIGSVLFEPDDTTDSDSDSEEEESNNDDTTTKCSSNEGDTTRTNSSEEESDERCVMC